MTPDHNRQRWFRISSRAMACTLLIVQYKQALQFIERYGQEIFGDVPVVFAGLTVEGYIPATLAAYFP